MSSVTRGGLRRGLTLIELIVVLIVIGLLAGLVAPQILGRVSDARITTAKTQIELLGVALENYRLDNGVYPTTQQGLEALRSQQASGGARNWRGPYLRKAVPLDPWGRPYIYRNPPAGDRAAGFDLQTLGKDGKPGGSDEDGDLGSG